MSADFSNIQPQRTNKGLAEASLILGVLSIPILLIPGLILGLPVVVSLTSILLGTAALRKIKKKPMNYGGRKMAVAGIVTSSVSLGLLCLNAVIMIPLLMHGAKVHRASEALHSLMTIRQVQAQFEAMNSRFATLKELAESSLIDQKYAGGTVVSGYVYSSSEISEKTYCVHAVRTGAAVSNYDFVVCEDGIIRFVNSKTPGVVKRGEGVALHGTERD